MDKVFPIHVNASYAGSFSLCWNLWPNYAVNRPSGKSLKGMDLIQLAEEAGVGPLDTKHVINITSTWVLLQKFQRVSRCEPKTTAAALEWLYSCHQAQDRLKMSFSPWRRFLRHFRRRRSCHQGWRPRSKSRAAAWSTAFTRDLFGKFLKSFNKSLQSRRIKISSKRISSQYFFPNWK